MILSQIAAMSKNRVIGVDNKLPWSLPEDLQFFKQMTKNKILIMGRKTFDSLPGHLPNRYHIVISRAEIIADEPDLTFVKSIDEALEKAKALIQTWNEEVMIVGGSEIYKQMMPITDRIYLTVIDQVFEGDAHFPEFDESKFEMSSAPPQKPSPIKFEFRTYSRKK